MNASSRRQGSRTHLRAYGTNIEGDWDRVFTAVKQCHEALHASAVPRISTSIAVRDSYRP